MVGAIHGAGLEVILDVVYNHTAEGNERGPTFVRTRASTTRPTTDCSPMASRATTSTTPAPATRST